MASAVKDRFKAGSGWLREVLQGALAGLYSARRGCLGGCPPKAQDGSGGAEGAGSAAHGTEAVAHEGCIINC